jgi:beta propeller repeat protein
MLKRTVILALILILMPEISGAETACSRVSIEILQELTLERIAFDAKMVVTNNIPDKDLSNIRVDVIIKDANGNVKNDLFYMRVSSTNKINAVDGTGVVKAATAAEVHWLIIPSPGAGGTDPVGVPYWAGATLTYTVDGKQEVVSVTPDKITVKPEAQLILDYFLPYEVIGDNPFTPQVEAPVPFPLAVRVLNAGYGAAKSLKIDSAQPKIVDNAQGLLVDFRLLGASVNDSAVSPSLTVNIGTLDSKKIATGYWEMISTLSGRFVEFNATFSHASDLGGELTSILKQTNTHYLVHRVKVNLPGRDGRLDYLADTDKDAEHLPDAIFESEIPGNTGKVEDARSPVKVISVISNPARPTSQQPNVELKVATGDAGWVYTKLPDPSNGMLKLLDVIRADGVHLDPNNFWIIEGVDANYQKIYTFHILDYRGDVSVTGTYTLVYSKPADDAIPPTTTIIFDGVSKGTNPVYITPETKIIFTAVDNDGGSGVDQMLRKVVGKDNSFVPALPMNIETTGNATLEYYSIDKVGNQEATKSTNLYVDNAAPNIILFNALPSSFMPYAPKGVSAARVTNFTVKATDDISALQATIDIAKGDIFSKTEIVKTFTSTVTSGIEASILWDGKDKNGVLVPTGVYTAQLSISDGLNGATVSHTSTSTVKVTVNEWFKGDALDSNLAGAQQYPEISGTRVVWQDQRNGNWDIFTKDLSGGASINVSNNPSDQIRPSISGNIIVWQDQRNGNWDIYGYDLAKGQEFVVSDDPGNQERPVISGEWVSWQDDRSGNWDIYAYNISTKEKIRVTSHERDQMHPAISGYVITWEDYRHGLGEIYKYDIATKMETRHTSDINNQTLPAVSGSVVVWTDQRNGQKDIYFSGSSQGETRVTYGSGDHSQAVVFNETIVYVEYEAGPNDPNLSFFNIKSGLGERISANPAKQEEPALGEGVLVWQDDRDGIYQIYWANLQMESLPIEVEIRPGFNLIAIGEKLVKTYPKAAGLIAANPNGIGIEKIAAYSSLNGIYLESSLTEMVLQKGMGIGLYASGSGVLQIGDAGETAQYTLLPGVNYIGMLSVPYGYTAYNLLSSVGFDNIQSVRRFNNQTGLWETASLRKTSSGFEAVGVNFVIRQGDGLIITMKNRVDGWKP